MHAWVPLIEGSGRCVAASNDEIERLLRATPRRAPRTWPTRHASKGARPSRLIIRVRLGNDLVKLASPSVIFNLRIPCLPVLLKHPITQLRELSCGKLADLLLNLFNFAHKYRLWPIIPRTRIRAKT